MHLFTDEPFFLKTYKPLVFPLLVHNVQNLLVFVKTFLQIAMIRVVCYFFKNKRWRMNCLRILFLIPYDFVDDSVCQLSKLGLLCFLFLDSKCLLGH